MARISKVIVDQLYSAFANRRKPSTIVSAVPGLDRDEIDVLRSTPLRMLDSGALSPYIHGFGFDCGSESDLFYFLPRVLEVAYDDIAGWLPVRVGQIIASVGFEKLSDAEQVAVIDYLNAVIVEILGQRPVPERLLDSWLCGTSLFHPRWRELLDVVSPHLEAVSRLILLHARMLRCGEISDSDWQESPRGADFLAWLDRIQTAQPGATDNPDDAQ